MVAIEPQTGKVRVMVSIPEYDPNLIPSDFKRLDSDPDKPTFNRTTQELYPPGSTFKVVTATAALDTGKVTPETVIDGSSPKTISGTPLENSGGESFGPISLTDALTNSVNTVFAQVGERVGAETLVEYMKRFGFYEDPQLDYPDNQMIPSGVRSNGVDYVEEGFDVGRVAIGQGGAEGALDTTPMQMALVAAAVANKGRLMKPRLVDRIVQKDGRVKQRIEPDLQAEVMKPETAEQLTAMMSRVVEEGTGTAGALAGIRVAGKTGTAEVGANREFTQPWFIAFAPVENPRIAIAVTVERTTGPGRHRGGADRQAGARGAAREAADDRGSRQHAGGRPLPDPAPDRLRRMADVYCAEDTHLGRQVALKVLHRRFAQDQEFVERFRREAKSAAGLQHPNVVGVFDRGEHEGTYYIAMEYLPGRTLKDIVTAEAPLAQERVVDLGIQILQAAGFAHRHGVIHRDFKPHNVIVDDDGNAKVTDFGIARAGASEMTETGSIMGTAQYLSPEQAQGHAVTAASDLYSIGVMLYEMLAGRLPFEGDSAVSVALKHLSEPPPPISQLRPDVDPALESVVMAALAKDPAQRWQSAEDFAAALEAARAQIEAGHNGGQDTAAFAPIPMPRRRRHGRDPGRGCAEPVLAPVAAPPAEREERRWPWFTIGLLTLALIGALLYVILSGALTAEKKDVPRVTGKQLVSARALLERAGFEVSTERVRSPQPFDQVARPGPESRRAGGRGLDRDAGGVWRARRRARSSGRGPPQDAGDQGARGRGPQGDRSIGAPPTTVKDFAIRTVPREGTQIERGTRVRLFVSSGPSR